MARSAGGRVRPPSARRGLRRDGGHEANQSKTVYFRALIAAGHACGHLVLPNDSGACRPSWTCSTGTEDATAENAEPPRRAARKSRHGQRLTGPGLKHGSGELLGRWGRCPVKSCGIVGKPDLGVKFEVVKFEVVPAPQRGRGDNPRLHTPSLLPGAGEGGRRPDEGASHAQPSNPPAGEVA